MSRHIEPSDFDTVDDMDEDSEVVTSAPGSERPTTPSRLRAYAITLLLLLSVVENGKVLRI